MKVLVYSANQYTRDMLDKANKGCDHQINYSDAPLTELTAILAQGYCSVCCFVDDDINAEVLRQ